MRLLPSQQKSRLEAITAKWQAEGRIVVGEPCDCNGQVRHNNGGNYHAVWEFQRDSGRVFMRLGITSDYDDAEWQETDEQEVLRRLEMAADWL